MGKGMVTETEPMPRLVVGNTEPGCSKWKRGKGFSKPNFEPFPSRKIPGYHFFNHGPPQLKPRK